MPTRSPIIPTSFGNRMLLRAIHNEMHEKEYLKEEKRYPLSTGTAFSGIQSNNYSEKSDCQNQENPLEKTFNSMPQNGVSTHYGWAANESGSGSGSDDDSNSSYESGQSDQCSSSEGETAMNKCQEPTRIHNKPDLRFYPTKPLSAANHQRPMGVVPQQKKNLLTAVDKQQIREGYKRHVVNGERQRTGASYESRLSPSHKASLNFTSNNFGEEIVFPLENAAAGKTQEFDTKHAKAVEMNAKRKTKIEKQAVAEAKLTVAEAKLTEFEAKLRARQARIDERHAKLCHRRAIIKEAEERLQLLESRLDDEEECHRERERRVRNRERRVKQEDAGIQIKEVSLKKRETKITADIKNIEQRKKLVEEKEAMAATMQDIMTKRENLHRQQQEKKNRTRLDNAASTLGRLFRKSAGKDNYANHRTLPKRNYLSSESSLSPAEVSSSGSNQPVPTPRKSLKSEETGSKNDKKIRSNSLGSMLESDDPSPTSRKRNNTEPTTDLVLTLPPSQHKTAVMGLWL